MTYIIKGFGEAALDLSVQAPECILNTRSSAVCDKFEEGFFKYEEYKYSLVLASASPRRLALLRSIGVNPDQIISPDINEERLVAEKSDKLVLRLAKAKALAVGALIKGDAFVIGADTIVGTQSRVFEKAATSEDVVKYLKFFSGRKIQIKTAISVLKIEAGKIVKEASRLSLTKVKFKRISLQELELYVNSAVGIGCAGGFNIQGLGETLIQDLSGSYSSVVGLPLFETVNLLNGLGYDYFKSKG